MFKQVLCKEVVSSHKVYLNILWNKYYMYGRETLPLFSFIKHKAVDKNPNESYIWECKGMKLQYYFIGKLVCLNRFYVNCMCFYLIVFGGWKLYLGIYLPTSVKQKAYNPVLQTPLLDSVNGNQ